jgi:hypothetical protein
MSNNKQNSIEWLINEIEVELGIRIESTRMGCEIVQEAKELHEIEREQLSTAWAVSREKTREAAMRIGFAKGFECALECRDDFYDELGRTNLDDEGFTQNYIADRFEELQGGKK